MKGLVLAGGKGTRLRPITFTRAKQLVPVANKPILFYGLEALAEAGIREVGMIVGETREEIIAAVGDGSAWGLTVTYIDQPDPLGLAHAVLISEDYLGEEEFVMYLGDNLLLGGITRQVEEFTRTRPNAQILLARVPHPEQFGVAEVEGNRVKRLEEKPKQPRSDLALVGVYIFDRHVFEAVKAIKPSWRNELEITDAIQYLLDHGYEVRAELITGWWKDTGKLEDMLEANRLVLDALEPAVEGQLEDSQVEGRVRIEAGAVVRRSLVRGPSIIGAGCRITESYVGPYTSVSPEVEITRCEVEHSIIMNESRLCEVRRRITDSLIGRNVVIAACDGRPAAHRFVLGDNSTVLLE